MELFEEIRREYEFGIGSIAGVARKFGVHRRLVREALGSAVPEQRVAPERPRPKIEPIAAFIDGILEADRRAPRKQPPDCHDHGGGAVGQRRVQLGSLAKTPAVPAWQRPWRRGTPRKRRVVARYR